MNHFGAGIWVACLIIMMCSISMCSGMYDVRHDLHRLVQIQEKADKP